MKSEGVKGGGKMGNLEGWAILLQDKREGRVEGRWGT